ncbi:MerR family transcriptional regulator [Vagococcus sp. WN89Y]|uniref:MerR family transcriptional regulator n=1 Tax=Vagococcus sp. WN89Y TaxID=3457258 RepID=UPI003FCE3B70
MAFYSIGEVAERCGINPVTLRAWQRRYGLLKPQRSEGGHRQFDESDIERIEAIKLWIESGVSVSKVKALLDATLVTEEAGWATVQEEMMSLLRQASPARLRETITVLGRKHTADQLIDEVLTPVRQRLGRDLKTGRAILSLLDGVLIDYAVSRITAARRDARKNALLASWGNDDRTHLWLEGWRLSQQGWRVDVFAEPLDSPHPEFFPGQQFFVWTGKPLTQRQAQLLAQWQEQGFAITFHGEA